MKGFAKCTTSELKDGMFHIDCKLGLWSVSADTLDEAYREAQHYFNQYKQDGEYSSIIGGESVVEKLSKGKL